MARYSLVFEETKVVLRDTELSEETHEAMVLMVLLRAFCPGDGSGDGFRIERRDVRLWLTEKRKGTN